MGIDKIRTQDAFPKGKVYTAEAKLDCVIWESDKNNFAICRFIGIQTMSQFIAKGILFPRVIGGVYVLTGTFQWNVQYAQNQFQIQKFEYTDTRTADGLINYLKNEAPGIGPKLATDIVCLLGSDALNIMIEDPNVLVNIPHLGQVKAKELRDWAMVEKKSATVSGELYGIGLTQGQVGKFLAHFGDNAAEKVKTDCFSLVKVDGIGFLTVCKIADMLGVPAANPQRIREGIKYAMDELMHQGHVYITWHVLVSRATKLLSVPKNNIIEEVKTLVDREELVMGSDDPVKFTKHVELFEEIQDHDRQDRQNNEQSEGRDRGSDELRESEGADRYATAHNDDSQLPETG